MLSTRLRRCSVTEAHAEARLSSLRIDSGYSCWPTITGKHLVADLEIADPTRADWSLNFSVDILLLSSSSIADLQNELAHGHAGEELILLRLVVHEVASVVEVQHVDAGRHRAVRPGLLDADFRHDAGEGIHEAGAALRGGLRRRVFLRSSHILIPFVGCCCGGIAIELYLSFTPFKEKKIARGMGTKANLRSQPPLLGVFAEYD